MGKIYESWEHIKPDESIISQVHRIVGGEIIGEMEMSTPEPHDVIMGIIQYPEYRITSHQLTQILDEGNHCISTGSIVYEQDYVYMLWSNLGHI